MKHRTAMQNRHMTQNRDYPSNILRRLVQKSILYQRIPWSEGTLKNYTYFQITNKNCTLPKITACKTTYKHQICNHLTTETSKNSHAYKNQQQFTHKKHTHMQRERWSTWELSGLFCKREKCWAWIYINGSRNQGSDNC